ncbi:MAG: hypothetical protein KIS92_15330 [Planctomycetota bacterium]|nr:hypothetical protein [Planctomycetota bacterium]
MSRTLLAVLLTCFCAACFAPRSAHALNIPGVKDKKKEEEEKKRKEEERKKKDEEDKKAAEAEAKADAPAPAPAPAKEDAGEPAAAGSISEMSIGDEAWAVYKAFKPGTFVEYSMPEQEGMKMRYEVTEVGENFIVINTITSSPQFKSEAKIKYVHNTATEKVSAAGKEFNATRSDTKAEGKVVARSWTSKEIPQLAGGLVKTEGPDGKTTMILSSYGEGK